MQRSGPPRGRSDRIALDLTWNAAERDMDMKRLQRQLVLNKGIEKFIFRYEQGREDVLLDALVDHVKDHRTDFDWFDASVLSFKLSQMLIGRAEGILTDDSDTTLVY